MRRYLPILLIACFMLVLIVGGTTYLSGFAAKTNKENREQLIVYTTLPIEHISLLAQEFERTHSIQIRLISVSEKDLATRLKQEADHPHADLVLAPKGILENLRLLGLLQQVATEQTDILPGQFKDPNQYWTGLWYDPVVFAVRRDYLLTNPEPGKWSDLARSGDMRLAMTDFFAADAAANLLFSLTMENGEAQTLSFLKRIHPRIIQYAKFLSTPVRMAGMGECDVAIAVQSETLRYQADGFPVEMVYPAEGTSYLLTGAAVIKRASHSLQAIVFLDWLLQSEAQKVLDTNRFYFTSVNPESKKYRDRNQQQIKVFDKEILYTPDEKRKLLDNWAQSVRLGR